MPQPFVCCAALCLGALVVACSGARSRQTASNAARSASAASGWALDVVAAPDRSDEDRRLDPRRRPAEVLTLLGVQPGMRVAELGAGVGYTAELLARAVAPGGTVYAQNSPWTLQRYAERPWSARLNMPVMKNVVRLDRPFDDPFPPDVHNLDAVLCVLFYHDLFWLGVDRTKMLRSVLTALRPGGAFLVIDHSARPGSGASEVQTLHRIDEATVRREVEGVGFRLRGEALFLRNPADERDWNDAPMAAGERRGTSDRFVLVYVRP